MITLVIAMGLGAESCKSTGKMSKKDRKAAISLAKQQLTPIIDGTTTLSLSDQEKLVNEIVNKKLNDPTINDMIIKSQQAIKKSYAERDKVQQQKGRFRQGESSRPAFEQRWQVSCRAATGAEHDQVSESE